MSLSVGESIQASVNLIKAGAKSSQDPVVQKALQVYQPEIHSDGWVTVPKGWSLYWEAMARLGHPMTPHNPPPSP